MRPIHEIADDILADMVRTQLEKKGAAKKPDTVPQASARYYAAWPYLQAMSQGDYGLDGQKSVVLYGLSNLSTYRTPAAKALKAELKEHVA